MTRRTWINHLKKVEGQIRKVINDHMKYSQDHGTPEFDPLEKDRNKKLTKAMIGLAERVYEDIAVFTRLHDERIERGEVEQPELGEEE